MIILFIYNVFERHIAACKSILRQFEPDNNTRIILLPEKNVHKATIISNHTSPSVGWLKLTKVIPAWIIKKYPSFHIYTDGSYKKCNQAYDDISLADNDPAHPDRIAAGASIIIAPKSQEWRDNKDAPSLCIHIKDESAIGAQSEYPM